MQVGIGKVSVDMHHTRQKPGGQEPRTVRILVAFFLLYGTLVGVAVLVLRHRFPETPVTKRQLILHPRQQEEPESPRTAENPTPPLLHAEPVEGIQEKILLTMELCERVNPQSIECWGYVSNLRDESSDVWLRRADVVDGKGNSFELSGNGQFNFPTGPNFDIPARSRIKYAVKVPDKDQDARALTLYLDISKPSDLEYTFRDVPLADN